MKTSPLKNLLKICVVLPVLAFTAPSFAQSPDFSRLDAHVLKVCTDAPERCASATERANKMKAKCAEDPVACEKKKAKFEERRLRHEKFCEENPATCAERKARHEERRKKCEADPEACKAEREAKREERRAKCEANPEKCKKWRSKHGHHRDHGRDDGAVDAPAEATTN